MNGQQLSKRAAKRMWAALRRHLQQGGFLLFDQYGKGGWWYADNEQPIMDSTDIPIACLAYEGQLLSLDRFTVDTQRWLDHRAEDRAREAIDVAAGPDHETQ